MPFIFSLNKTKIVFITNNPVFYQGNIGNKKGPFQKVLVQKVSNIFAKVWGKKIHVQEGISDGAERYFPKEKKIFLTKADNLISNKLCRRMES